MSDSTDVIARIVQLIKGRLPALREWDDAEKITDWPAGFCHGENDYQQRVIAALDALASSGAPPQKEKDRDGNA